MLRLSRYLAISEPFVQTGEETARRLIFSTRSLQTLLIAGGLWDKLVESDFGAIPADFLSLLRSHLILVDETVDELSTVIRTSRAAIAGTRTLYECIQPTGFCNFGCAYCGQDHAHVRLRPRDQTLLVDRVAKRLGSIRDDACRYELLRVGWFGGEPLAAIDIIRKLSRSLQDIARQHGCAYDAHIVTNGFGLVPAIARELVLDLGVTEIELTLDGPAHEHDRRRVTSKQGKTFERIYQNLEGLLALDLPVDVSIRCNVDRYNCHAIPELIDRVAALPSRDRLRLYFAPIHDWGNDASQTAIAVDEYAELEIEWMALMLRKGLAAALIPAAKPIVCMAVNPHAELIDPFGQTFNCTEVSLVPAYGSPNVYARGTLSQERTSQPADMLANFLHKVEDKQFGCANCPMLPVCGGACPKQWESGKAPCPSAKRNISDRLLLAYAASQMTARGHERAL
ncbi:radical SAM/SPASM domain-containing protein [Aureimonas sp. SA4125]|uniref:radical SAM/SPASM domain-containing protein n=1 Tax=Aureimonas sp. SA4125 TaxID=2826993 RepID=UPI001CC5FB14|nr:radical SAM protein [Aureimonas sp. SA4125]BDA83875.1 radical SAM/SPASM domain-containing protein [Aureimonas sp. SA4125]